MNMVDSEQHQWSYLSLKKSGTTGLLRTSYPGWLAFDSQAQGGQMMYRLPKSGVTGMLFQPLE